MDENNILIVLMLVFIYLIIFFIAIYVVNNSNEIHQRPSEPPVE